MEATCSTYEGSRGDARALVSIRFQEPANTSNPGTVVPQCPTPPLDDLLPTNSRSLPAGTKFQQAASTAAQPSDSPPNGDGTTLPGCGLQCTKHQGKHRWCEDCGHAPGHGFTASRSDRAHWWRVASKVLPKCIRCPKWKCYRTSVVSFSVGQVPKPFQGLIVLGQQRYWRISRG